MLKETNIGNPNKLLISGYSNGRNEDDIIPSTGKWILGIWSVLPVRLPTLLVQSCFLHFLVSMCFYPVVRTVSSLIPTFFVFTLP